MAARGEGRGEEIGVATVAELPSLAQFGHCGGEVAHGDVCLCEAGKQDTQVAPPCSARRGDCE